MPNFEFLTFIIIFDFRGLRDDSEGNNHNGGQNGYELASQNVVSTIGEVITPRKLVEEIIQKGQPTGSKKVDRLALGITKELEHPEEPVSYLKIGF